MRDINALIVLLALAAAVLASGCASARHNTTYTIFPSDPDAIVYGPRSPIP